MFVRQRETALLRCSEGTELSATHTSTSSCSRKQTAEDGGDAQRCLSVISLTKERAFVNAARALSSLGQNSRLSGSKSEAKKPQQSMRGGCWQVFSESVCAS